MTPIDAGRAKPSNKRFGLLETRVTSFAHIIFIANAAFLRLPKLAQWTIISLAKSVIASALMSAVTLYATGFFAIRHGFRVPIEGVPYLSFAVGIATFATFALTMLLFGLVLG